MARPLSDIFTEARAYLDTDELNFSNPLCDVLMRRIWFQAVTMEREWRFFQRHVDQPVLSGQALVPFSFFENLPDDAVPATRLLVVMWNRSPLVWREVTYATRIWTDAMGEPVEYSEANTGLQRNVALYPAPSTNGTLNVDYIAEPVYPSSPDFSAGFVDLPDEFEAALLEGLLAEMYMREEDTDLYDIHRQMFLEQMGSIRNRWRESLYAPMVMAGRALREGGARSPFGYPASWTQPVAR